MVDNNVKHEENDEPNHDVDERKSKNKQLKMIHILKAIPLQDNYHECQNQESNTSQK